MQDKYSANVFWSEEDDCFIATCSEFPLLSAHGESKEEALSEFQTTLELAIESYKENGIELPSPMGPIEYSGQLRIRIPKSLHKKLAESASNENVSLNTHIVSLLSENNASANIFAKYISTMRYLVKSMEPILLAQQSELQVHTERLNLLESQIPTGKIITKDMSSPWVAWSHQTSLPEEMIVS